MVEIVLVSYLIGSIPFGYLIARSRGIDIIQHGSGNIGATNVGRVLGRRVGFTVFALDFAKGALPVAWAAAISRHDGGPLVAGLAAFLGHCFPVWLRFRGGKGVATGAGVVFVFMPGPALAGLAAWLVCAVSFRYVSLASVVAALTLCLVQAAMAPGLHHARTLFGVLAALLVLVRHRSNVVRLVQRRENQLEEAPVMLQLHRSLHVLALGLWFGASVFFTFVVGLSLFNTFETIGAEVPRPAWLPLSATFSKVDAHINGPREQGARVAGAAVAPMFDWYFALQGACGLVALATALPWSRAAGVHRWRLWLLGMALVLVLAGWPVEKHVSQLRRPRNHATEEYLQAAPRDAEVSLAQMQAARSAFARWHGYSLVLNLVCVACVTAAMALAGNLPAPVTAPPPSGNGRADVDPKAVSHA
jgi:glycerol-3-phosphate acyltransferase PlsY